MKEASSMVHEEIKPRFRQSTGVDEPSNSSDNRSGVGIANGSAEVRGVAPTMVWVRKDAQIGRVCGKREFRTDMGGEVKHDRVFGLEERSGSMARV